MKYLQSLGLKWFVPDGLLMFLMLSFVSLPIKAKFLFSVLELKSRLDEFRFKLFRNDRSFGYKSIGERDINCSAKLFIMLQAHLFALEALKA